MEYNLVYNWVVGKVTLDNWVVTLDNWMVGWVVGKVTLDNWVVTLDNWMVGKMDNWMDN